MNISQVAMASLWSASRLVRTSVHCRGLFFKSQGTLTSLSNNQEKEISFSDHRAAYAHLTRNEILRAWIVLKLCSFDYLIQNSIKVIIFNPFLFLYLITSDLYFTVTRTQ